MNIDENKVSVTNTTVKGLSKMRVYIVIYGEYDANSRIFGVYTTKELAQDGVIHAESIVSTRYDYIEIWDFDVIGTK